MIVSAASILFSLWMATEPGSIRRLDGSKIGTTAARDLAVKTLTAANVTGAQIVILEQGRVVWSEAFGYRRMSPRLPMDRETTTWAASITKAVFGTYVMMLVERGEFSLDRPIAEQLEKPLNTYEPYREIGSELVNDPAWRSVTPRMLLSHSAGLRNFAFLEPDKKMHLHFKPGTQFSYSGDGIGLVQFVIEQQKKRPLDQLMDEAIFRPLAMKRTGAIYKEDFAANVADRYGEDQKFLSQTRRFPARAAGSMTTSAEDLGKFAEALFAGKLLKKSTRRQMLQPYLQIRTLHQFGSKADDPEGAEARAVGLAYGMGWGLLQKTRFGPAFFKEGHGDGAQTYMLCFEKRKACMIILTNSDNGEKTFRTLLEGIWADTVTPWEWEGYP